MSNFAPTVRQAERPAVCRCCDGPIAKGEEMVSWYSWRNRGQNIHLHLTCAERVGQIAKEAKELTK